MKQAMVALLGVMLLLHPAHANGPISETEKWALTGKVWGFLKYHHPHVASGQFNWDAELFRVLPEIKAATTKESLSQVYLEWIQGLGQVKDCRKCKKLPEYGTFDKNLHLNWIQDTHLLTAELSEALVFIEQNRHQGKKYYVSASKGPGNIQITNETLYKDVDWTNEDVRLLTLFRYWNVVEYFFPYKFQTDIPWDTVLQQSVPRFLYPKSEQDFHLAMLELVVSMDDSHGVFFTDPIMQFYGMYFMPASFDVIEDKVVITGFFNDAYAKKDDLQVGDVITKFDDRSSEEIIASRLKYTSGSNSARKRHQCSNAISNGPTDVVTIEYIRDGQTRTKQVSRYLFKDFGYRKKVPTRSFSILEGNIGYVNMGVLTKEEVPKVMAALKETEGIIFDLRSHPNGTLYAIADYTHSQVRDFYKAIYPDLDRPGRFIWKKGTTCGVKGELKYKGKVVLLVNEGTQSHAEFTAMCLQTADNAITVGSQTSGADGNVSTMEMAGGQRTMLTGMGIFYPDNTETQRKGVRIDVLARPTIEGIKEGRDEVLEKALECVKK
jgi:carboxyl-terminal processing protease